MGLLLCHRRKQPWWLLLLNDFELLLVHGGYRLKGFCLFICLMGSVGLDVLFSKQSALSHNIAYTTYTHTITLHKIHRHTYIHTFGSKQRGLDGMGWDFFLCPYLDSDSKDRKREKRWLEEQRTRE